MVNKQAPNFTPQPEPTKNLLANLKKAEQHCQKKAWEQVILACEETIADCWEQVLMTNPAVTNLQQYIQITDLLLLQTQFNYRGQSLYKNSELRLKFLKKYQQLAAHFSEKKRINPAIICYQKAIQLQPESAEMQSELGNLFAQQENWQQAIACYQQAIQINPQFAGAYLNLGKVFIQIEKYQKATEYWEQAWNLELNSRHLEEYLSLGETLQKQAKWQQAEIFYRRIIELKPNDLAIVYQELGKVLQQQKKHQEAIAAYEQAIKLNPKLASAYFQLSLLSLEQGESKLAIHYYRQGISLISDLGAVSEAILQQYKTVINQAQNCSSYDYFHLAKTFRAKGLFAEAVNYLQKTIELEPTWEPPYIVLQYTPIPPKQLEELIGFYRCIVEKQPQLAIVWGNLGDALTEQGKIAAAIKCYQTSSYNKAIAAYPQLAEREWLSQKKQGPDFIIIGAAKCGTTSLYQYLSSHPQILVPHKKELNFFTDTNFAKGIDWYLAQFPSLADHPEFLTGEATTIYFDSAEVPPRIQQFFPDVKLILLLRNPVERAVSWHYHKINTGLETRSIEVAIKEEINSLKKIAAPKLTQIGYRHPNNLLGSLYIYKLKRWLQLFPQEQILVLQSEELYNQPETVMKQVFDFLEIPPHYIEEYRKVNVGSYTPISKKLRQELLEYFQPYNQKLGDFLNRKFNSN